MKDRLKTVTLVGFFGLFVFLVVAALLAIPATLIFKIYHGADLMPSALIAFAYLGALVITGIVMVRFKKFDPIWGTIFGLIYYGILFVSVRL